MLSVLSEANTNNTTNPDVSLSLWRERNSIISDTETKTKDEPGHITPEETSQTMETTTGEISQTANSMTEGTPQIKTESLVKEFLKIFSVYFRPINQTQTANNQLILLRQDKESKP